ncbi:hypothetical protein [Tautonia marina]|uniref:hypothetical protein n=1 Tax=Tautonia marina TaxID=2653855 RepID=UPI001260B9AE|nr:hypothetical protein [Tautonia marina]
MRMLSSLGTVLFLALSPALSWADDDRTLEAKSVQDPSLPKTYVGFYKILSGENDGKPLPQERLESHVVRITQEMIVVLDADENELYSCSYTLDLDAKPHRIDMESTGGPSVSVGQTAKGIMTQGTNERDEPFVMLCYRLVGDEYPEAFRTRAQSEMNLFVLQPIPDPSERKHDPSN